MTQKPVCQVEKELDDAIAALKYLMQQFDGETWHCERCGHDEDTASMDSAHWLRDWFRARSITVDYPATCKKGLQDDL